MEIRTAEVRQQELPICVDLDGTLVKTDTLIESSLALLHRNWFYLLLFPWWLLRGRALLKRRIAERTPLNVASLPYNEELLSLLQGERKKGRRLVLATAADQIIASRIADHLGCFAEVLASNGSRNLKGAAKLRVLEKRFGAKGFDYAGNSRADVAVWRGSNRAIVVAPSSSLAAHLPEDRIVVGRAPTFRARLLALIAALRMHQWAKNILLFLPMVTAHNLAPHIIGKAALAFGSFSLFASANYLINDLLDLAADRNHERKRFRPFASGELPLGWALAGIPLALAAGTACALLTTSAFVAYLAVYLACAILYSVRIKRIVLADVLLLAALYDIRIMAGGSAVDIPISQWLLGFSMFLFLSLAFVKRYSELRAVRLRNGDGSPGRGYVRGDLELLLPFGIGSGYLSVLVLALYLNSPEVRVLYFRPQVLWLTCPVLLYWISRIWMMAYRGEMDEDPVLFAVTDKVSYAAGLIIGAIMLWAL